VAGHRTAPSAQQPLRNRVTRPEMRGGVTVLHACCLIQGAQLIELQWLPASLPPPDHETFCFVEPKKVSYRHLVSVGSPFGSWIIASGNFPEQPFRLGPSFVGSDHTVSSDLHKPTVRFSSSGAGTISKDEHLDS
jgi:hypothetical protein